MYKSGKGSSKGGKYGTVKLFKVPTPFASSARNFRSKNVPRLLMTLGFIALVIVSLTQMIRMRSRKFTNAKISSHFGRLSNSRTAELRAMDRRLRDLRVQDVPSIEMNRRQILNSVNVERFKWLIAGAPSQRIDNSSTQQAWSHLSTSENVTDFCPPVPPDLQGNIFVDSKHSHNFRMSDVITLNPNVKLGGMFQPRGCIARHRVAIIIPYRDRQDHLVQLLAHLHPILQRQQLDYRIFVSEQYGSSSFNKGILMNTAFKEALSVKTYDCFIFHDVDLVPENDNNMYTCPPFPRHMSVAIDKHNYKLMYNELVGGVLNIPREAFFAVNGYSNLYWGWGAEDDDMFYRMRNTGMGLLRPPVAVGRYKMLKHTKRKASDWSKRKKLLYTEIKNKLYVNDGLNSLKSQVMFVHPHPLYTHIMVDVGQKPTGF